MDDSTPEWIRELQDAGLLGEAEPYEENFWEGTEPGGGPLTARHFLDHWMLAVEVQHERANESLPPLSPETWATFQQEHSRRKVDSDFYIVALYRLRRCAAELVPDLLPGGNEELEDAIAEFDGALPHLKGLRDSAAHFDDYAKGKGRALDSDEDYYSGFGTAPGGEAQPFLYLGDRKISLVEATERARKLYQVASYALTAVEDVDS